MQLRHQASCGAICAGVALLGCFTRVLHACTAKQTSKKAGDPTSGIQGNGAGGKAQQVLPHHHWLPSSAMWLLRAVASYLTRYTLSRAEPLQRQQAPNL